MSKFKSRKEKHEHRLRQEAERRERRRKDKEELEQCRKNHPNQTVGVNAIIPNEPGDYAGIQRVTWKEYGEIEVAEVMNNLRSLPGAIEHLESRPPAVRDIVLQDYANWRMENDCYQLPDELALFLRVSIAKTEFTLEICKAMIGAVT